MDNNGTSRAILLDGLQADLGVPLPASTQWEIVEAVSTSLAPVLDGLEHQAYPFDRLVEELGVTRISLGGTLARAAYGALFRAVSEIQTEGTFGFAAEAAPRQELEAIFAAKRA